MMKTWLLLVGVMTITKPVNMLAPLPKESRLNFAQLVARGGADYSVEEHTARTSDGYVLGVHRVRRAARNRRYDVPVLLMHGFITTDEEFARMGRNRSLVFLLADEGFDVWLGNFRGNEYTAHVSLEKTDRAFWNYGLDEHGALDIPAIMEAVRMGTGTGYVHFVGYSMGSTCYHIMCHARPDMAARVVSYTALAPAATFNFQLMNIAMDTKTGVLRILRRIGLDPLGDTERIVQKLVPAVCGLSNRDSEICLRLFAGLTGEDPEQVDWSMYSSLFSKLQPPSLRLVEQYVQLAITGTLSMYDYGKRGNLERYGQPESPKYDLTANRAPVALFVGKNDLLTPLENAKSLAKVLRKTCPAVYGKLVDYEKFNHIDFIWAKDVHKFLNYDVVKRIVKFSQKYNPVTGNKKLQLIERNNITSYERRIASNCVPF